jgi:hypothetical protein
MQNPPRPKSFVLATPTTEPVPERRDVVALIEALFEVLERHEAGPNEGVLALMTSFIDSAARILESSSADDTEHNRESLLAMLEQARRAIDTWSGATPSSIAIH